MTERREAAAHPIRDLLGHFDTLHKDATGKRYLVNGAKDSKIVKDLREVYSDDEIRELMTAFFAIEDDFIATAGYSIGIFRACLPKVLKFAQRPKHKVPENLTGIAEWLQTRKAANE
jgi:hypothetical protein